MKLKEEAKRLGTTASGCEVRLTVLEGPAECLGAFVREQCDAPMLIAAVLACETCRARLEAHHGAEASP